MKTRTSIPILVSLVAMLGLAGCAKHEEKPASTLTEAQRDTALARSSLPGAAAVDRAMQASGREATRAAGMDTLAR